MTTFTDADAEIRFRELLACAEADGEVRITRDDGKQFLLRPVRRSLSEVGVVKVKNPIGIDAINALVREGRERSYDK